MVGMLEELLAGFNSPNPGIFRMGKQPDEPDVIDYAQGFPIAIQRPAKTGVAAMDADLGRFQETNPVPPKPMPQQQPLPGMLASQFNTVPAGVGGNPAAPPAPVAPLPPATDVPAPPQVASLPPAAPAAGTPQMGGSTDVSAAARVNSPGAAPAPAPAPASMWDKIGDGLNRNSGMLLAMGAGFAGAPSFGTGMSRGFAGALTGGQLDRRNREADEKKQLELSGLSAKYRALVASGVPPQLALAAVQDPKIMEKVAADYIGDSKKELKTLKNDLGAERAVIFDPKSGAVTDVNTPATTQNVDNTGLSGDEYLADVKKRDPGYARTLQAYVNGDIPLPSGRAATQPQGQKIIKDVLAIDPTVNANDATARYRAAMEFKQTGRTGKNITNVNTAITHAGQLHDLVDKLGNSNSSMWNNIINPIRGQLSPEFQKTRGQFDAARQALSDELETAMRGGGSSVAGIKDWKDTFDAAKSPAELKGSVQQAMKLLGGRLDEIGTSYHQAMGKMKNPIDFIRPENQELFKRLQRGGDAASTEPSAITQGLVTGTLKAEDYPQQAALLAEAKRRGLKIPGM